MQGRDKHVDALLKSYGELHGSMEHINSYYLPNREQVGQAIEMVRALLFPGYVSRALIRATDSEMYEHLRQILERLRTCLWQEVYRALHHKVQLVRGTAMLDCPDCAEQAKEIVDAFLDELVGIREKLSLDVEAHYRGDPASSGADEIIFCYPGLYAMTVYRMAHALHRLGTPLTARMMASIAHERVGIDIHPGAKIGDSMCIDHGTGLVIGETTTIGDRVRLYQGVTLGALSVRERTDAGAKRHPTIEDDVIVYAGATILGGKTTIGKGAIIGGNCWITSSVAPGVTMTPQSGT